MRLGFSRGQLAGDRAAQLAELAAILGPLLGDSGPVTPLVTPDYDKLFTALKSGTVEMAWLPPLEVARSLDAGAHALVVTVRRGTPSYRSALLVKKGGPIGKAADLRGQAVGWVDRHSAAGYLHARDWLLAQGLGQGAVKDVFLGSHRAACEALMKGEVAAVATWMNSERAAPAATPAAGGSAGGAPGGGSSDRVDGCWQEVGAGSDKLALLADFGPIPGDALVAAPILPEEARHKIVGTLEKLHELPRGAALLRDLLGAERLAAAGDEARTYRSVTEVMGRLRAAGLR